MIDRAVRPRSDRRRWRLAATSLVALASLGIGGVLALYLSYKYPVKQDRYQHRFSQRIVDRAKAYALLFRSPARSTNVAMPVEAIQDIVRQVAESQGVDACLVAAVVTFESGYNPNTITTTGAMGLMALQPETAAVLDLKDPFDPRQNVDGGTRLLKALLSAFDGDVRLVLASYNAGEAAIRQRGGVPRFRETQDYVRQVGTIHALCEAERALFLPTSRSAGR